MLTERAVEKNDTILSFYANILNRNVAHVGECV